MHRCCHHPSTIHCQCESTPTQSPPCKPQKLQSISHTLQVCHSMPITTTTNRHFANRCSHHQSTIHCLCESTHSSHHHSSHHPINPSPTSMACEEPLQLRDDGQAGEHDDVWCAAARYMYAHRAMRRGVASQNGLVNTHAELMEHVGSGHDGGVGGYEKINVYFCMEYM